MARYAGHVQVVTTEFEGVRRGVTVTAACSVSDNPPTVLVCLNGSNASNAIFERSGVPADERFALGDWKTLVTGAPVLADAVVSFDCRLTDMKRVSTHFVMFGEVKAMHFGEANPSLIYLDRGFRSL